MEFEALLPLPAVGFEIPRARQHERVIKTTVCRCRSAHKLRLLRTEALKPPSPIFDEERNHPFLTDTNTASSRGARTL